MVLCVKVTKKNYTLIHRSSLITNRLYNVYTYFRVGRLIGLIGLSLGRLG